MQVPSIITAQRLVLPQGFWGRILGGWGGGLVATGEYSLSYTHFRRTMLLLALVILETKRGASSNSRQLSLSL